jgi:hypothetical protein
MQFANEVSVIDMNEMDSLFAKFEVVTGGETVDGKSKGDCDYCLAERFHWRGKYVVIKSFKRAKTKRCHRRVPRVSRYKKARQARRSPSN